MLNNPRIGKPIPDLQKSEAEKYRGALDGVKKGLDIQKDKADEELKKSKERMKKDPEICKPCEAKDPKTPPREPIFLPRQ